jgi:hypothetical protein
MPMISRMLRHAPRMLVMLALAVACAACGHSSKPLLAFRTEEQAQAHCPDDTVVWLNFQNATYYLKGQGSYGHSEPGRYSCRNEADSAGMHETANP